MLLSVISAKLSVKGVIDCRYYANMLYPRLVLVVFDGKLSLVSMTNSTEFAVGIFGKLLSYGAGILGCLFNHFGFQFIQTVVLVVNRPLIGIDNITASEQFGLTTLIGDNEIYIRG